MESKYEWVRIGDHDSTTCPSLDWFVKRNELPHIMEIMGPPIEEVKKFECTLKRWIQSDTTLCISGELKTISDGCPASNYRYKNDVVLNSNVIENYVNIFDIYSDKTDFRPIIVITIPRDWRIYSWYLTESGSIQRSDKLKNTTETDLVLMSMLKSFNINETNIMKLRESCRGARYNTYLADMISFLYQTKLGTKEFYNIYNVDYRNLEFVKGGPKINKWSPDPNMEYLYYERTYDSNGYVFYSPKNESVFTIYKEFEEAIDPYENNTKKNIRNHLLNNRIDRWSDFDGNDIDDALTMLMLLHSFKGIVRKTEVVNTMAVITENVYVMTDDEKIIYNSIEREMKFWFDQLI